MLREKSLLYLFMVLLFFTWSGCGGGGGGGSSTPATTTTTQTPSNIAGTWRGTLTSSVLSGNINAEVTFSQSGSSVSGTLACYKGTLDCGHSGGNVTGTVSGSSASLTIQFADNQTCTVSNASISSSTITGQYDCQSGDKGIFAVNKAATSSQNASLAGTWKGTSTSSTLNGMINITVVISQNDTSLSGTYACTAGTLNCVHSSGNLFGTLSGDSFTSRLVFPDTHSCGEFNTTVSGNTISGQGSCDDPQGDTSTNTFSLTKQ